MGFGSFDHDNFQKWLGTQDLEKILNKSDKPDSMVGEMVEPKINKKSLFKKIEPIEGDLEELVEDFKYNGGIVLSSKQDEYKFLIETDSGTFLIPKLFVRLAE